MNDFVAGGSGPLKHRMQRLHAFVNKSPGSGTAAEQVSNLPQPAPDSGTFSSKRLLFTSALYLVQALVVAWILTVDLALPTRNLAVPIVYNGDAIYFLMMVKAIVREGWWWHVRSLSAPFQADLVGMPLLGDFDGALIKFIALFTHKAGLVLNVFWFTTIVLAGVSSTWSMLRLGIQRSVAFVLGILYAVSPHIFYRSEAHLMLTHHVIPPVALLAVLLCAGRGGALRGTTLRILLAVCFLMGLSYAYFAFFSCFILLAGGVAGYWRTREFRILQVSAIATAVVAVTFGVAMLPTALTWRSDPALRRFIGYKAPAEADIYGLKIRQLIEPTTHNPFPFLAKLELKEEGARFPLDINNESSLARIGTVASLGLLALLAIGLFCPRAQMSYSMESLKAIAVISLACVLLATVGGFGSIFNLLVAPDVRCYSRISIFIAFLSIAAFGIVLTAFLATTGSFLRTRIPALHGSTHLARFGLGVAGAILLGSLLWFGVADQNEGPALNWMKTENETRFQSQSRFVKQIEDSLPRDAMVYQLPDVPYFEGPHPLVRMFSNDNAQISAVSDRLRWSWPATSTPAVNFAEKLKSLDELDMVDTLRDAGFRGIFIDRFGYTDNGVTLTEELADYLGHAPIQSENARYEFFALTKVPKSETRPRPKYRWGTPLLFTSTGNAKRHLGVGWAPDLGTEGTRATMYFDTPPPARNVIISALITPALFANITVRPVRIFVNDTRVGDWEVRKPGWYTVTVPRGVAQKQVGLSIRFELPNASSPQSLGIGEDPRVLSIAFEEMKLTLE